MISKLPAHERPRERLWFLGVEALSERELLALVLRQGRRGESALDLAAALLADYGGLHGVAAARPEELASRTGVGAAKAASLIAAFRLGALTSSKSEEKPVIATPSDVAAVASPSLARLRRERVLVLVCNSANRLQRTVAVSEGAVDRSLLPVREILNAVLRHDGRSFAVAHNHPSGDPTPSDADFRATGEIGAAAKAVGLRFLGHVVVAGDRWATVDRRRLG